MEHADLLGEGRWNASRGLTVTRITKLRACDRAVETRERLRRQIRGLVKNGWPLATIASQLEIPLEAVTLLAGVGTLSRPMDLRPRLVKR